MSGNLPPGPSRLDPPEASQDSILTPSLVEDGKSQDGSSQDDSLSEDESTESMDDLEFLDLEDEEFLEEEEEFLEEEYLKEDEFLDKETLLQREKYLLQAAYVEDTAHLKDKKLQKHLEKEFRIEDTISTPLDVNARSPLQSASQGTHVTSSSSSSHDLKLSTSSYYSFPGYSVSLRDQSSQTEWAYKSKSVTKLILQEKGLLSVNRPQRAFVMLLLSSILVPPSIPNRTTCHSLSVLHTQGTLPQVTVYSMSLWTP
ncbi:rCG37083 [Rattus norvegicus]|uniref:RCG37083 n=1 Tax=Rattus norvegicus TaxID=10116 RepID=A6HTT2_RAT|nr:rCG37083 [Rattus norvegicus]